MRCSKKDAQLSSLGKTEEKCKPTAHLSFKIHMVCWHWEQLNFKIFLDLGFSEFIVGRDHYPTESQQTVWCLLGEDCSDGYG